MSTPKKRRPVSRRHPAPDGHTLSIAERLLGPREAAALAASAPSQRGFLAALLAAAAKRIERLQLHGQRDRSMLERVAHEIPFGVFVVDNHDRFVFANRSAGYFAARRAEDLTGRSIEDALGAGPLASQFRVVVERARSGKAPLEYELSYALTGGATFDVGLTASLAGEASKHREEGLVVVVARDLHAPGERLKLRTPASISAEQQAELRQRLQQVERQMARSERLVAIGQMAAGFVHEINNPLGALSGLIQILQMELDAKDPSREMLEEVAAEVDRIHRIADSMLELARSSSGSGCEVFRAVDLASLARSVLRILGPQLRIARVKHDVIVETETPWVLGDPDRLKQILMNLILNAAQAMSPAGVTPPPGGKIAIRISADVVAEADLPPRLRRAQDLAGQDTAAIQVEAVKRAAGENAPPWRVDLPLIRIEVADTGPGVPPDVLEHIFEPFFTTKPPGEGTGLGLSTVEAIVRAHGGVVRAANAPAGGAVFSVRIPACAPPSVA